jgi:hypothetical protein
MRVLHDFLETIDAASASFRLTSLPTAAYPINQRALAKHFERSGYLQRVGARRGKLQLSETARHHKEMIAADLKRWREHCSQAPGNAATVAPYPPTPLLMRSVVGYARLASFDATTGTYLMEAKGLDRPARLLKFWNGNPLPDLSSFIGKVLFVSGYLPEVNGNIGELGFHPWDLQEAPAGRSFDLGPLMANVTGNLGADKPAENPRKDRISTSICYSSGLGSGDDKGSGSWLHAAALFPSALCKELVELEPGCHIHCFGELRHYDYKNAEGVTKPRTHLELLDVQVLRSGRAKPNASLLGDSSGRAPEAQAAPDDAFSEAA